MAAEVFIPKMSDHMEFGEVVEWLVQEGSAVEKGQPILAIMTDKATVDLEAPIAGILKGIRPGVIPGAQVPIGETVAFVAAALETVPALPPLGIGTETLPAVPSVPAESPPTPAVPTPSPAGPGQIRATPFVRRLAKELGIDLALLQGTGPEGRITEQDLRQYADRQKPSASHEQETAVAVTPISSDHREDDEWLDPSPIQRLTGQRMLESVQTAPHFALSVDVDMTNALQFRETWMARIVRETGERLSVTGLLVKIVAAALKAYPRANSSYQHGRIHLHPDLNIGVAMGSETGLVVPVIREANSKTLVQITRELKSFQDKAQSMRFSSDDLAAGTFTISNLGMYGIDRFNAIINPPQSAILAVGRIVKTPVGMPDDTIALRPLMNCTLSVDHRSLDGVQAATFLAHLKELLEHPYLLIE